MKRREKRFKVKSSLCFAVQSEWFNGHRSFQVRAFLQFLLMFSLCKVEQERKIMSSRRIKSSQIGFLRFVQLVLVGAVAPFFHSACSFPIILYRLFELRISWMSKQTIILNVNSFVLECQFSIMNFCEKKKHNNIRQMISRWKWFSRNY